MEAYEDAVVSCWRLRQDAANKALARGSKDPGLRAGVTSGAHLDPLADFVATAFVEAGIPDYAIWNGRRRVDLPATSEPRNAGTSSSSTAASWWRPLSSRASLGLSATT